MATNDDSIKKNISKNITKCREGAGLSQKELALLLNITPSRVSNWEQGSNCPTIDMLFELCKILDVSINDIYGVYPDSNMQLAYEEMKHIEKYRSLDDHGKKIIDFIMHEEWKRSAILNKKTDKTELPTTRLINYYYRLASAGLGQILFDMPPTKRIEIPDLPEYRKADYAIGVNGNSMEPTYSDGDMLLVEMTEEIAIGEIGIFTVNNECFVKKLGNQELISLNPEYSNIPLNETTKCMGRVIGKL